MADDWFQHSADEGQAQQAHGKINAGLIINFLLIVILLTFLIIWVLVDYFKRALYEQEGEVSERRTPVLADQAGLTDKLGSWDAALEGEPIWLDAEQGTVRVPLKLAKQQVIEQYAGSAPPVEAIPQGREPMAPGVTRPEN